MEVNVFCGSDFARGSWWMADVCGLEALASGS
jgi:hypothetical protein